MNSDHSEKVASKIEALCSQGCNRANQILEKARNGNAIDELSDFERNEIEQIIHELEHIMSVYDNSSPLDKHNSNCND